MAKKMRKLFAMLLAVCMVMSLLSVSASAETVGGDVPPAAAEWPLLEGEKTAAKNDAGYNLYDVTVKIPGGDDVQEHDEVILMVDGSYSMDEEWEDMKKAITLIGDTVLNGTGNTQLTMMSFGISPNVVLEHVKSVEELTRKLPALPGGLLYGRSATNCDGAFEGIEAYISEHDDTLRDAFVIFLSDGGANLNSEPVDWIAVAGNLSAASAQAVQLDEFYHIALGNVNVSNASAMLYGDEVEELAAQWKFVMDQEAVLGELDGQIKALAAEIQTLNDEMAAMEDTASEEYAAKAAEVEAKTTEKAALQAEFDTELADSNVAAAAVLNAMNEADAETGKTKAQQWVIQVYKDFYVSAGLTEGELYPVYVAEYAYVDYQRENNFRLNNTFYYVLGGSGIGHDNVDGAKGYYAGQQAALTAQVEEISTLYLVRYGTDHRSGWMTNTEGTVHVQSPDVAGLCTALQGVLRDLQATPYNDVTVTDYMSKWVNLKPETIKVKDKDNNVVAEFDAENSDVTSGTYNYKWTGTPLCAEKVPVILEKVNPEDYAAGGEDVVGNTSGDIYKITWNIKDGPLYRADNYYLTYQVEVDVEEDGFVYQTDYPANGNTELNYKDENGDPKDNDIDVPEVKAPAYTVTVKYVDKNANMEIPFVNRYVSPETPAGSDYDVTDKDQITIPGYTYDSTGGDALTGVLDEDKVVIVYYIMEGGGSITPNIPITPIIPNIPTDPTDPEGEVDLEDPEVPLGNLPEEDVEIGEEDVPLAELPEEDVPLAMAPATGDAAVIWTALSALSGAGLFLTRKKREDEE